MSPTDDTPDIDQAVPAVPPAIAVDNFAVLLELLKLVNDSAATERRISALRAQEKQLDRAKIELVQEQSRLGDAKRELERAREQARKEFDERERVVRMGEDMLAARTRPADPHARLERLPSGGAHEPDEPPAPRSADPHFGRRSATAADDETETVPVGPKGSTLTRTIPRPRRTMRRVPEPPNAA